MGREEGMLRETEETGLSSDILSECPGYCVLGETTPVIVITHRNKAASGKPLHTHTK